MITLLLFGWSLSIDLYYFFDHSLNRIATLKKKTARKKICKTNLLSTLYCWIKKKKKKEEEKHRIDYRRQVSFDSEFPN